MKNISQRVLLSEINVTPLVDVMLVLLIIFMVTAPMLDRGIQVDLPKAVTGQQVAAREITITLTKEHVVYLNREIVTLQELRQQLSSVKNRPVVIEADKNAYVSKLVELWDICRQQGLHQVHIVTLTE
jgi:biopolymer transport protein TolR